MDKLSLEVEEALNALDVYASPTPPPPGLLDDMMTGDAAYSMPVHERSWIVSGLIPSGGTTLFAADGGVGKSLLAMQVGNAVASGRSIFGRDVVRGPVLALFGEDDTNELVRRHRDVLDRADIDPAAVADHHFMSLFGRETLLGSYDKASTAFVPGPLYAAITDKARAIGARLVVLDNVTQMYPGDINNPADVTRFLQALNRLALEIDGAVLLLAHVAKSEGSTYAGTAAWRNGVRQALTLTKPRSVTPGADALQARKRVLEVTKSNYGASDLALPLVWDRGAFSLDEGVTPTAAYADDGALFLSHLDKLTIAELAVSHHQPASNYAPRIMAQRYRLDESRMAAAMADLIADGTLLTNAALGWKRTGRKAVQGLLRAPVETKPDHLADLIATIRHREAA